MMHTNTMNAAKLANATPLLNDANSLIQAHGRSLWTTSQLIADKFGKRHDNILRAVANLDCSDEFRRLNFEELNYLDEQGKPRKNYDISRDGFSILAMGFTGKSAAKWKEQFIAAFGKMERELQRLASRKTDPALRMASSEKSAAAMLMTDCLIDARKAIGKDTKPHHFANEHSLCNWVLTGCYGHIEEHDLERAAMRQLAEIRRRNTLLIMKGESYSTRKATLREEFPLINITLMKAA